VERHDSSQLRVKASQHVEHKQGLGGQFGVTGTGL
jgi:hypothetical protein